MNTQDLSARLDDLETRYAFQEETIRQLDEVLRAQATELDRLNAQLKTVREQLKETLAPEAPPEEQVPPHY
jgi:SlyX protein